MAVRQFLWLQPTACSCRQCALSLPFRCCVGNYSNSLSFYLPALLAEPNANLDTNSAIRVSFIFFSHIRLWISPIVSLGYMFIGCLDSRSAHVCRIGNSPQPPKLVSDASLTTQPYNCDHWVLMSTSPLLASKLRSAAWSPILSAHPLESQPSQRFRMAPGLACSPLPRESSKKSGQRPRGSSDPGSDPEIKLLIHNLEGPPS